MSTAELLFLIAQHVSSSLTFPTQDPSFHNHIAAILTEEPPISGFEVYEMVSDFFEIFQISRP